jgi:hypothetical protein
MSYESRVADFGELTSRFSCEMPGPLLCAHQIEPRAWQRLRTATALYMSRCLPGNRILLDEDELLHAFETERACIRNITPNGMIVPKREMILEFNALARALADIFESLGIGNLIVSWHYPLNLRIKYGEADDANLGRSYATESLHTDTWAGDPAHSILVHLPIFGDLERNHLIFYDAPPSLEESWLRPLPDYAHGEAYARQCRPLDFFPRKGQLTLADIALIHASNRLPGAGIRVSIDTRFNPKRSGDVIGCDSASAQEIGEYIPHSVLTGLGATHLYFFPDSVEDGVPAPHGLNRHVSNVRVLALGEEQS